MKTEAVSKTQDRLRRGFRHGGFTLIELLVVVAIILILMGITFNIIGVATRKAGQAQTMQILEQVKNALGAYYTTYGIYPPVSSVYYEYENQSVASMPTPPDDLHYTTGLVYYIFNGAYHNPDAEAARWQHYLEGIGGMGMPIYSNNGGAFNFQFTNSCHTISDAWGSEIHYQCIPPDYQQYRLWSEGPNKEDNGGGGDDIGVTSRD
ncbi:MAG: type II secretion system protein [bacterium]